jgi:cytochrome c oxidase subunit I
MRLILSLGMVRGTLTGLAGTAVGVGLAMLVRLFMGLVPWNPGADLTIGMFTGALGYLIGVGVLDHWARWSVGKRSQEEMRPPRPAWARYFGSDTNHKVIGIQYLVTALIFLPFAVALQVLGRFDLTKLIPSLISPSAYESVISDHGIVMLFIVVLPAWSGLMNYVIPLLIGSRDVAFPHLNAFTYGLLPPAGLLAVFSLAAGGFDTGWTVYAPLSSSFEKVGMNLVLVGVFLSGLSSILTAVNILTTIFKMRAPGMTLFRMPIFVWSTLATTGLSLVFTQYIAVSFLLVLFEKQFGLGFFRPDQGGQPLLYQYLFWFYSHPAVYVFVLPGLGILSDLVSVFSRKPLFGYAGVAISSPGIAIGGVFVFAHHMFAAGIPALLRVPFMVTTLLVSVPTGVKVFAWVATMWQGKLRMAVPFLFVLSSMMIFLIGGLMGIPLGVVPTDLYLHDTYFVVGHFHAMLFGGFFLPLMAGIYYWYPKATGRMLSDAMGRWQWALMTLGTSGIFIPLLVLGLLGQRRRVADYTLGHGFQQLHIVTFIGALLVFAGVVILIVNIVRSMKKGVIAGDNPWQSRTLEWTVPSPPPEDNFVEIPRVVGRPNDYGVPGSVHSAPPGRARVESNI